MMTEPFSTVVERVLPYDGPHSSDTVEEAASDLPALVRYLNDATGPWNAEKTLRFGDPSLYDVRRGRPADAVARDASARVLAVRDAVWAFADAVTGVRELTVHLGHDDRAGGEV